MTINLSHIKLLASKVMSDVDEGGGGPSSTVLQSGVSNNIFQDVTEADRAGGDLSHRQLFLGIQSGDNSVAMGCNVIVQQPPTDANVSVLLMATEGDFATRAQDVAKLEAGYVASGTYSGYLYGGHIAGMQTMMVWQMPTQEPPTVGARLALIYHEGKGDEQVQYISVIRVVADVVQEFTDAQGTFQRRIVTLQLGQSLKRAFPGIDVQRTVVADNTIANTTRIRTCVWSPAAKYYGVKKLTLDAAQDDFTVKCSGIYERVVPSAEAETPLVQLRTNQQATLLLTAGVPVTFSANVNFSTSASLSIGGAVTPGSLTLARQGVTITDSGGRLLLAGAQVGNVDYANGLCTLLQNAMPGGGSLSVTYTPAMSVPANLRSFGVLVTAGSRRTAYVVTLPDVCAPGTLQVHYRASGSWYVLTDDGSGALSGADTTYGAGQYLPASKTLAVTLGALPDVDSMILLTYGAQGTGAPVDVLNGGRVVIPINAGGVISADEGAQAWQPGSVSVSWTVGGTTYTATDDGAGHFGGAGTGTIDYARGTARLAPTQLPPPGTELTISGVTMARGSTTTSWTASGSTLSASVGEAIAPGTVSFSAPAELTVTSGTINYVALGDRPMMTTPITDDGAGNLKAAGVTVGTVNYSTGALAFNLDAQAGSLAQSTNVAVPTLRVGSVSVS